jgi:hypothetical protein
MDRAVGVKIGSRRSPPWDRAEDLPAGRRAVVHQVRRVTDIRPNALPAGDPEDNSEWLEKVD